MKRLELYRCPVCQEIFEVETTTDFEIVEGPDTYRTKMTVTTNMQVFFMHIRDTHREKWRQIVREAEAHKAQRKKLEAVALPGLGKFCVPNDPLADAVLQYQEGI